MRADQQLSFVLVVLGRKVLVVTCSDLTFVTVQVLLDVLVDKETTLLDELVEGQRILSVVNFALEHWIQVLKVDVCVLDQWLGSFRHENDLDVLVKLVQEDVHDLKNEGGRDGHDNLGILV
jgi:hypothetical protein